MFRMAAIALRLVWTEICVCIKHISELREALVCLRYSGGHIETLLWPARVLTTEGLITERDCQYADVEMECVCLAYG